MDPIDRAILEFCQEEFRPLKPLQERIPKGTLYRHAKRLVKLGWVGKESGLYRTTEPGLRQLIESQSGRRWDALERVYPPLAVVPTPVHRAMIELILAAAVARRHEIRPDRHPFFVAFGRTLRWKTSAGTFVCHALGLDPALHVIDCGAESGKSLTVRRSGTGEPTFKRELLEAPFVVLDEFLTAETSVRSTLAIFLSGRLVMPFENGQLRVCPVPLLTLNPREKPALEQRIGLSAPQIRRAILADLDAVPMPDLAVIGERALEAARAHRPLELGAPAMNCGAFREAIVELTRSIVTPEAQARVDVEVVVTLATGMTAFIANPAEAIAQVGYDVGVLAETLGWTRPGWIEAVTHFSLKTGTKPVRSEPVEITPITGTAIARVAPDGARAQNEAPPRAVSLAVPERVRRRGHVPDLELSDETRMRLIWLAHETGRNLDEAIDLLLDHYLSWRGDTQTMETMEKSLALAAELEVAQIEGVTLERYLADRQALAEHNCTFEDVPEALRMIEFLSQLPVSWDWKLAEAAMQGVATLMEEEIAPEEVGEFIARHRRLKDLGFDEALAEAVAEVIAQAGAVGDRRDQVLRSLVEVAKEPVDRDELAAACRTLGQEVTRLEARKASLESHAQGLQTSLAALREETRAAQTELAAIRAEWTAKAGELDVLRGLRAFLLRHPRAAAPFFEDLRKLDRWQRIGGAPDDIVGAGYAKDLVQKFVTFFEQVAEELKAQGGNR